MSGLIDASPEIATAVMRLCEYMRQAVYDEVVTYAGMSDCLGQEITKQRYLIAKALKLLKSERLVFVNVHKMGYKRIRPEDAPSIGKKARLRIRQQADTAITDMASVVYGVNDLDPAVKREVLREQSALGTIHALTKEKALPKVDQAEKNPLTAAQVARQFLDSVR